MTAFATLLRRPGAKSMFAAGLVGRLPMGMVGLGLTLMIVGQTGSYTLAGAISATTTIALAVVGPYGSRMSDRIGQGPALCRLLAVNVTAFALLALAVDMGWPVPVWFVLAALAGASIPNLGAMTRARWMKIARTDAERSSAFAMESVADEISFVIGPVVASALALGVAPVAPVAVGTAFSLIGGLALAALRRTAPVPAAVTASSGGHPFRMPGMGSMFLVMLLLGGVFGSLNVSTVAFAELNAPTWTGILLGIFSFGSLLSGLALGAAHRTWRLTAQVRAGTLLMGAALLPLAFIDSPTVFAAVAFIAGLSVSTVLIGAFGLVERFVHRGRLTEALSLMSSGLALGISLALSVSGVIIDHVGPSYSFGLAALCAGAAATMVIARFRRLAELEAFEPSGAASASGAEEIPAAPALVHS